MAQKRILVVDDEQTVTDFVVDALKPEGYDLTASIQVPDAIDKLCAKQYALVITDIAFPDGDGMEIVRTAKKVDSDTEIIIITAFASINTAVEAVSLDVFDYIEKPFSIERIRIAVRNAFAKHKLSARNRQLILELEQHKLELQKKIELATVELKIANEKLSHLAITDALTELYNHRYLNERLEEEVKKSLRYNIALSLLMIDLDNFKEYNDTYGHQQGDKLLKQVADVFLQNVREVDLVARYGGDEFAIVLPQTNGTSAVVAAEKLRKLVDTTRFLLDTSEKVFHLTLSIGVATIPTYAKTVETLTETADTALYRAKQEGGNRVCLPP